MARKDKELTWEQDYVDKVAFLNQLYEERLAFLSTFTLPGFETDEIANGDGAASMVSGDSNEEKVWNFFAQKGFTAAAVAGIMGNLEQESGIDPKKKQNGGGPGTGLCQWEKKHANGGGRWEELVKWAKSEGRDEWDIVTQLDYLWKELSTGYVLDLLNRHWGGLDGLKTTKDYKKACDAFEKSFERAGKPNMPNRYKFSEKFLDKYGKGDGSATASLVNGAKGDAKKVIEIAESWLKKPNRYVFGSGRSKSDIAAGRFDCSSWVRYVFEQSGYDIGPMSGTTTKTLIKLGKKVSVSSLKPGDLVFYDTDTSPGHVAISLGDGKAIGTQSSTGVGVIDHVNNNYWKSRLHSQHRRVL